MIFIGLSISVTYVSVELLVRLGLSNSKLAINYSFPKGPKSTQADYSPK